MDNEKFGNFIKELRKEKGITQKELGEKLNITDKAISKWERGLSFPDITMLNLLAEFFEVDVSELLNGEKGNKKDIDIEKVVNEAIEKYKNLEEKRKFKIKRIKKITGILSLIILIFSLLLQGAYLFVLKRHNFEYVIDSLEYIINEIIIISATISIILLTKKKKIKNFIIYILCVLFTTINIAFMCNNGFENKCLVSFSSDFSNELVLKANKSTGAIKLYRNQKLFLFAKEKEQFDYELEGNIKKQWLTNDICEITYKDKNGKLREFVVTYGDRGNGISYYYVTTAISGNWQVFTQYGNATQMLVDSKGITIKKNGKSELFEYENCKQYGTISLVLYKNDVPKYVIALDKNCEIDEKTNIIKKGGTITLSEISMEKTVSESLYCMTYKNENDLSDYNVVSVGKNDYKIKNGIMYISFDGKSTIEVPGDFSNMVDNYNEFNYQISEEKTIFYYIKDSKRYLVYSDDMGANWNTVEIENTSSIQNIHFVSSNIGFMLKFEDVAMGTAFGKISKTVDGGKNWTDIYFGIGNEEKIFKRFSQIKFVDENIGFLTMPSAGGENSELYITKDGGNSFSKLEIIESDIYDYYNLPIFEEGVLSIKITQGSDGDYNGGDYKIYYSKDYGNKWSLEK